MTRVFISYCHEDAAFAEGVAEGIKATGRKAVTFGRWEFGTQPDLDVASAVRSCDFFLSVLTSQSPNSIYELGVAVGARKPVLLILGAEQGLPLDVGELPCIFVRTDKRGVEEAVRAIDALSPANTPQMDFQGSARAFLLRCTEDEKFLDSVLPEDLEAQVSRWFTEDGTSVDSLRGQIGVGADFFAYLGDGRRVAVDVKKRSPQSRLSVEHVRALIGTIALAQVDEGWLISTCAFTASARSMAEAAPAPVRLLTLADLVSFESALAVR